MDFSLEINDKQASDNRRAIISDIHLSGFQSDVLDKEGLPWRLGNIIETLKYICEYCKINGIKFLDLAGDIINDKSIIYTEAQEAFCDILISYKDHIHFTLISGNHDLSTTGETQKSAVSVFKGYPNVTYIDKPTKQGNIMYIPFAHSIFDDIEACTKCDILVSHFGINEAMLQSGISIKTEVKLSDLKKFKLVLLGHYHKPQELSNKTTKLYYCGSTNHLNWSDKNEKKRFLVYNPDTLEVESVPLDGFIEYHEYTINSSDEATAILEKVEKDRNFGHKVRVFKKFKGVLPVVASDVLVFEPEEEVDPTNRGLDLSQTKKEKLVKYLEIKGIPVEEHEEYLQVLSKYSIVGDI